MRERATAELDLDPSKAYSKFNKFTGDVSKRKIEPSLSLGKITTDFTKFEQSLDAATARVVAFTATTSLLYGVGSAFKRLTQDAIQIESVMARIQSIFGSTASETKQFQSAIFGLANDVGLSFFQVAEAAEEFSRQGLSLNKTLEATRAAAVVAKLSGAELKGVIEGLTATLSTFNDGTLDYIQVANKLVALDSAFATSAAGITEGLKRVSGVAVQAGLSFDETAAAITSLKQVTGRSEAVIGNSLKSIFTSLQTEKVQKDLATLGVETKDASGEFRNLVDVLSDLSKVYGTLGDAQKTVIAQRIGKTYQANAFQGILRTFETGDYEKALTTSKNAGSSAEDRLEKLNQTTQSALQRFSNNITQLGGNLGEKLGKPLLDTVVGYMNSAIEAGNKIFGGSGLGDALVGGLKNVLEGPGVVILTFSVAKLLTRIIKESGQAIKSIAGLSGAKENILRIDQFITSNLSEQNKVELERIKTLTSVAAQQKAILNLMNRQLVTQEKMRSQGVLPSLGVIALQSLGPAAASKAAKKIPNRGKGELPEINKAILREAIDIKNGVGGARITASPMVKTLNLGKGPEKVVVNSDEKIVKNFAGSGQDAVLNREMMGFAGGSLPKKIIGYHGTSMEFGGKIDPTRSMGESQGQGFYIFKRKSDAVSHAKNFLQDEPGRKKLIAGRFPTSKLVPDYEVHTPQAVSFLRNNPQLLQGVDTPIGRKGFRLIGGTADKTGVSFIQKSPFSDASIRKRLNLGTTGDVGTGMMLGPLFDSLRSGPNSKLIRQFEESLINSRKGRAFRYIGGETKAYSKNISSGYMPSFDGSGQDAVLNRGMLSLATGAAPKSFNQARITVGEQEALKARIRERLYNKQRYKDYILPPLSSVPPFVPPSSTVLPPLSFPPPIPLLPAAVALPPLSPLPIGPPPIPPLPSSSTVLPPIATFSRVNPIRRSPSPNYTPISPIRGIKAPVPPQEKIGTRPSIDVRGNSLFGDAAKRASAEAELNKNRERADRISNLIDSKKGLTQNAKQFVGANRGLFGESSLSSFDKRNRSFSQKIGGIGSKISNGVKNFNPGTAAGAGFAISFIGGSVAEGFKTKQGEDTQSSRGIGGLAQGVGIGAQLALFGKTAGIVGLVAGAAVGLNTAFGENLDRLNGLSKKHDNLVTKYRDEANAIDSYGQNFESLSDAISSGSKKAAIEARKNLTAALGAISDPGFISELSSASSVEEVSRISNRISEQRGRELAGSEALSSVAKLRQENRQSFIGQTGIFGFGGGRNYAPDGSYEAISNQLIKSIDFSKFSDTDKERIKSGGFKVSDLDETNRKTLEIFSKRFKGEEIILKALERRVLAEEESTESVENLGKVIQRAQDFTNVISGSAQKASYSIFEKIIKSSLTSSLADISLQGAKPFTSEIAFAESQFAVDKSRRSQDLASKSAGLNASLIEKAQELTKGRNLDFAQLGKIQGAFSKFGETQDVGVLLKDFEGIIGTDSKELVKLAQGQFLESKKLNAETAAGNQEADARQRTLIEELKRGQRATLFGGGLNKFDRGQANPGLVEILRGPKYNKFNDPTRPGFGVDARTGRTTFSAGEFAQAESDKLDANAISDAKIIQRAQYLQESGYFGVEPTADTPQYIKDNRRKLIEQERKPLIGALTRKRQAFARDSILAESGERISKINEASKNITGQISITDEQKKIISDAIKSGSYDTAIGAFDESTKDLRKNYEARGKVDEIAKIDAFKTSLLTQKENVSNIPLAAEEQAKGIIKDQTIEGKNIQLLTDIKDQEVKTNENLSAIASLMARQEAAAVTEKRVSEYNIAAGDVESLKAQREDNYSKYNSLLPKIREINPSIENGGVEGVRSFLRDSIMVNEKAGGSQDKIAKMYSLLSELRNVKSDDEMRSKIKEKQSVVDSFQDVKNNTVKDLTEKLGATFGKISEKLDSFFGGDKPKTSKIDQNINLDINATVVGTNVLASEDFKNSLTAFVGSYVKNVWKENTGNIMIEPPSKNSATA